MLWLGKVFKLREKLTSKRKPETAFDEEKPFLDHLEDLRDMLFRVVGTLLASMILCFVFNDVLFKIVREPVLRAGIYEPDESKLPDKLSVTQWKQIGQAVKGSSEVSEQLRENWLNYALGADRAKLEPYVLALELARSAKGLPKDRQAGWLEKGSSGNAKVTEVAKFLLSQKMDLRTDFSETMRMQTFGPVETFNQSMKLSFVAGIIIAFPLLMYFILQFVLPGLKDEEKRIMWPSLFVGFGLFLIGVCFCYFWVAPSALKFFYTYALERDLNSDFRFSEYVSFVTQLTLIFGVCFEVPVVVYALNRLGLVSYPTMARTRSYAVIIILIAAAVISPTPDAFTMCVMAGPMILLYEISIWIAYYHYKKDLKQEAEEERLRAERRQANAIAALEAGESRPDAPHAADHDHDHAHGDHHGDHHGDPHREDPDHHYDPHHDPYHNGDGSMNDSDHHGSYVFPPSNDPPPGNEEGDGPHTQDAYHTAAAGIQPGHEVTTTEPAATAETASPAEETAPEPEPPVAPGSAHGYAAVNPYAPPATIPTDPLASREEEKPKDEAGA